MKSTKPLALLLLICWAAALILLPSAVREILCAAIAGWQVGSWLAQLWSSP